MNRIFRDAKEKVKVAIKYMEKSLLLTQPIYPPIIEGRCVLPLKFKDIENSQDNIFEAEPQKKTNVIYLNTFKSKKGKNNSEYR